MWTLKRFWGNYEQFHLSVAENLVQINKFPEKYNSPKLKQEKQKKKIYGHSY
jgi:hypothetical protein